MYNLKIQRLNHKREFLYPCHDLESLVQIALLDMDYKILSREPFVIEIEKEKFEFNNIKDFFKCDKVKSKFLKLELK